MNCGPDVNPTVVQKAPALLRPIDDRRVLVATKGARKPVPRRPCQTAITAEVFWYWKHGQADGPVNLPATAGELEDEFTRPYGYIHRC